MASLDETCLSTALFSVTLGVTVVLTVMYLVCKVDHGNNDARCAPWLKRIVEAVPVAKLKIAGIALQIVTQVSESGVGQHVGLSY